MSHPTTITSRPASPRPSFSRALLLTAIAAASLPLTGCYERVVGARGPGANAVRVEQSYQTDNQLDRWIFGEETTPRHNQPRSDPGAWNGSR